MMMLLLINTVFEVVLNLWVFFWVAILQDDQEPDARPLPLGRIFACFMACMSFGSLIHNLILHHFGPRDEDNNCAIHADPHAEGATTPSYVDECPRESEDAPLLAAASAVADGPPPASSAASASNFTFHCWLACLLLILAGAAHTVASNTHSTQVKFLCFTAFEGSLGMMYPTFSSLRATMFPDECRATLTALFRLPFNILVTVALVSGIEEHRQMFLVASGAALLAVSTVPAVIAWKAGRALKPTL